MVITTAESTSNPSEAQLSRRAWPPKFDGQGPPLAARPGSAHPQSWSGTPLQAPKQFASTITLSNRRTMAHDHHDDAMPSRQYKVRVRTHCGQEGRLDASGEALAQCVPLLQRLWQGLLLKG